MSIVVKTVDGIITEIHGIGLEEYKFGDLVHYHAKTFIGEHYFKVISPLTYVANWVSVLTKDEYLSLIDTDTFPRKVDLSKGQVYFRYHRGTLADAMKTAIEVKSLEILRQTIIKDCECINPEGKMNIKKYGKAVDVRIGWDTYIVTWDKQPIGFLSGELKRILN